MLDYQKHYKSKFPHLIDPVRGFEKKHNRNGWPFYMIADEKGTVVYRSTTIIKDDERMILAILDAVAPGKPMKRIEYKGVSYPKKIVEKNEVENKSEVVYPYGVRDEEGNLFVCSVENPSGENRFCMKSGDRVVAVSEGLKDAYYGVIVPDGKGGVWSFFSALSDLDHYDIFARYCHEKEGMSDPVNLTESQDDAMHPDAAMDSDGNIWVTYYRWHFMGYHSRDKEIYARCFDGKEWSEEIRVSPEDLPVYEDHTDPSIAPHPEGGVVVAWSWDMHQMKDEKYRRYQTMYHAESPTIFGRRITAEGGAGDLMLLGSVAIDSKPELHLAFDSNLWCAWNSLKYANQSYAKSLHVSYCEPGEKDMTEQFTLEKGAQDISNPRFLEQDGRLRLAWCSQDQEGEWTLKCSTLNKGAWSWPITLGRIKDPRGVAVHLDEKGFAFWGEHPKGPRGGIVRKAIKF